jgi:hypothetical protein
MRHSKVESIFTLAVLAVIIGIVGGSAAAQSTPKKPSIWQQMKDAAKQAGQQGQPQQQPQQPGQRPPRPGQQAPGQAQGGSPINDSGPFKPPAGTKIEEKILAPVQDRAKFEVSPHGVHVATIETDGSRAVVWYDGAEGPKFDEILPQNGDYSVAFSPDGNRYAYCARSGSQLIVMVDGKELTRSSESIDGHYDARNCDLGFTANSKHVYYRSWVNLGTEHGKSFMRFVFDGKPSPPGSVDKDSIAISPDSEHFAYTLTISDPRGQDRYELAVDGKPALYFGGAPQWSTDSKHLFTQARVRLGPQLGTGTDLLLDGKPIMRAYHMEVHIPPVGDMFMCTVNAPAGQGKSVTFLTVGSKKIPGSEVDGLQGAVETFVFSPDGKHFAALYRYQNSHFVMVDGKKQLEYQNIQNVSFTADSSKVVYRAGANGKTFVVLGDQESDAYAFQSLAAALVIAPVGNRVGSLVSGDNNAPLLYMDGTTIRPGLKGMSQLQFNSDGTHYAYVALDSGNGTRLAVDGVAQPASNFGATSQAIYAKYTLSPDGRHVAHFGYPLQPTGDDEHGLFLDGRYMPINHGMNTSFLTFSPDNLHLVWFQMVPSTYEFRVVVDGKPVVQMESVSNMGINNEAIKWFDFLPDGTLLVLGQDEKSIKRISITPSAETSLATMLGGDGVVAARK